MLKQAWHFCLSSARMPMRNLPDSLLTRKKHPVSAVLLGQDVKISCGATRLGIIRYPLMRTNIRRHLVTPCQCVSHTLSDSDISVRPRKSIRPDITCCDHTARSSLLCEGNDLLLFLIGFHEDNTAVISCQEKICFSI